jgi:pullulanase
MNVNFFLFRAANTIGLSLIIAANTFSLPHMQQAKLAYIEPKTYTGTDLGLTFSGLNASVAVWSPDAEALRLKLYRSDIAGDAYKEIQLLKDDNGVWRCLLDSSSYGSYYTLQAKHNEWRAEVPGPYAKAVGRNGLRGHIIDPAVQQPEGWAYDKSPYLDTAADIILYELHVRDFSIHPESGMVHKGKFLAFTERGTKTPAGLSTGVDHLIEIGVTHVHLLPAFDFFSVDEARPELKQYNWGYDPHNYNVPEGSYATNAADGGVRIKEFKYMVQALHNAGIRVVMDVVYNHTGMVEGMSFEELNPGYFYRKWPDGRLSNASGCGNETASERPMVRKFIVESLKYWMEEYHLDGFRFDLMAIHDMETMREIERTLRAVRHDVYLYGEGWTADGSPLPEKDRSLKKNVIHLPGIAAFSDDMRDGIKGSWHKHESKGFVGGETGLRESVKFGIVGAIWHPQVDYTKVNNSSEPWAAEPIQCINYVSCHDNHTLFDKLKIANPDASEKEIQQMHILSNTIVLTSQGVPFIHAGAEFMRTKGGVENSYKSPDEVNWLEWPRKGQHQEVYLAYQALIRMRKEHPAFKFGRAEEVRNRLQFLDSAPELLAYSIDGRNIDSWKDILMVFNGGKSPQKFDITGFDDKSAAGDWKKAWYGSAPATDTNVDSTTIEVPAYGAVILYRQ